MANIADVKQSLSQLLAEQAGVDISVIKDDSTLEGLGVDELDQAVFLINIEEKFTVSFGEDTIFTTFPFAKMAEWLAAKSK